MIISDMTSNVRRRTQNRLANRTVGSGRGESNDAGPSEAGPSRAAQHESVPDETADDGHTFDDDVVQPDPPVEPISSLVPVNNDASTIERLGASLDPFESLPVRLHFSTLKLLEYSMLHHNLQMPVG